MVSKVKTEKEQSKSIKLKTRIIGRMADVEPVKKVHGTCADLAKYYSSSKYCISGDIGIDKIATLSKQSESNCAEKTVVINNTEMQMICDIPVLFGKWNSHSSFIHIWHITTNNPFLIYWQVM